MAFVLNWASILANHTSGLLDQNSGNLREAALTPKSLTTLAIHSTSVGSRGMMGHWTTDLCSLTLLVRLPVDGHPVGGQHVGPCFPECGEVGLEVAGAD